MVAYLDSSVILRSLLGQTEAFREWDRVTTGVASALVEVECLRMLDRLRLKGAVTEEEWVERRVAVFDAMGAMQVIDVGGPVLSRAGQTFPAALGTLDAIHLATALFWREATGDEIVMATHDTALAKASRAVGLLVIGTPIP